MATLTPQQATLAGTTFTTASASGGGDKVRPVDGVAVLVTNGGGSPITVTIVAPGNTEFGVAEPDPTVTVANGTSKLIGPFSQKLRGTDGLVALTYSGVTSVTVAAVQI